MRSKRSPYLTKRMVIRAAKSGVREAAKETMAVMGYVIIAENGWIVRKYPNGDSEPIEPIPQMDRDKYIFTRQSL